MGIWNTSKKISQSMIDSREYNKANNIKIMPAVILWLKVEAVLCVALFMIVLLVSGFDVESAWGWVIIFFILSTFIVVPVCGAISGNRQRQGFDRSQDL